MYRWPIAAKLFSVVMITASCAVPPPLPSHWAVPVNTVGERCPDISGRYANVGETADGKRSAPQIYRWFANIYKKPGNIRWADIETVEISQPDDDTIQVTAHSVSAPLFIQMFKKSAGDFACLEGWLKIKASRSSADQAGLVRTNEVRRFAKVDGYLIEGTEYENLGIIVIIPFVESGITWVRYAETKKPSAEQSRP